MAVNRSSSVSGLRGWTTRLSLVMADRSFGSFRQASTRRDTPPCSASHHPNSDIALRMGKPGKREFVQVLRLLEVFELEVVAAGVRDAIDRGAIGFDAVKHLVLCRLERRPPRLCCAWPSWS